MEVKPDRYVDKVVLVNLPNNLRPRYRWIVRKRDDGRYVARAPKIGVLIRDLKKKLDNDFNSEHLLPKNFNFWKPVKKSKSKRLVKKYKSKKSVKKLKLKKGGQEISQEEKMQNILNFVKSYKGNELFEEQLMKNLREDSHKTNRYYKKIAEVEEIVGYLQSQNKLSNRQQNYLIEKLLNNDKMRKKYYNIITSNYPR